LAGLLDEDELVLEEVRTLFNHLRCICDLEDARLLYERKE
jgi:hypothetical protein